MKEYDLGQFDVQVVDIRGMQNAKAVVDTGSDTITAAVVGKRKLYNQVAVETKSTKWGQTLILSNGGKVEGKPKQHVVDTGPLFPLGVEPFGSEPAPVTLHLRVPCGTRLLY